MNKVAFLSDFIIAKRFNCLQICSLLLEYNVRKLLLYFQF